MFNPIQANSRLLHSKSLFRIMRKLFFPCFKKYQQMTHYLYPSVALNRHRCIKCISTLVHSVAAIKPAILHPCRSVSVFFFSLFAINNGAFSQILFIVRQSGGAAWTRAPPHYAGLRARDIWVDLYTALYFYIIFLFNNG